MARNFLPVAAQGPGTWPRMQSYLHQADRRVSGGDAAIRGREPGGGHNSYKGGGLPAFMCMQP